MKPNRKVRAEAKTALVPGIAVYVDNLGLARGPGAQHRKEWIAQASAQIGGRQQRRRLTLQSRPLRDAIEEVCAWRAHAVGGEASGLVEQCWRALSPALLSKMRQDGVDVRRRARDGAQ